MPVVRFKRFFLFGWPGFEPSGGMQDFLGNFETMDEAKDFFAYMLKEQFGQDSSGHIFDIVRDYVVATYQDREWVEPSPDFFDEELLE